MVVATADDRQSTNRQQALSLLRLMIAVASVPSIVLLVVLGVLTRNPLYVLLLLVAFVGGNTYWWRTYLRSFDAGMVRRPGLRPADPEGDARLHNLVDGLCVAHGVEKPALLVLDDPGRNAGAVSVGDPWHRTNTVVVTTGLLDALSRVEMEGVLAQLLTHIRDGDTDLLSTVAAVGSTPIVGSLLSSRCAAAVDPEIDQRSDVAAVRMTRYPPGLADALDRLREGGTAVGLATPSNAQLWIADPLESGGVSARFITHPPLEDRIAVLREL